MEYTLRLRSLAISKTVSKCAKTFYLKSQAYQKVFVGIYFRSNPVKSFSQRRPRVDDLFHVVNASLHGHVAPAP